MPSFATGHRLPTRLCRKAIRSDCLITISIPYHVPWGGGGWGRFSAGQCRTNPWPTVLQTKPLFWNSDSGLSKVDCRYKCRCHTYFSLAFRHLNMIFQHYTTRTSSPTAVHGRSGCTPFHSKQYGYALGTSDFGQNFTIFKWGYENLRHASCIFDLYVLKFFLVLSRRAKLFFYKYVGWGIKRSVYRVLNF